MSYLKVISAFLLIISLNSCSKEEQSYDDVRDAGIAFLEANKSKEGVVTTNSGLQYVVVKEGNRKYPTSTDNVTVHYHGTTIDGTVFDSSVDRGETSSFGLNQVIKGWTEGLQLMGEGAKFIFYIPQELAYGKNPRPGGAIKPYMALVFEVELFNINN
jgi:FKBP-type peptidyl-prolyl cis-trans isomerase FklB